MTRTHANRVRTTLAWLLVALASGSARAELMSFNGVEVAANRVLVKFRPQAGVADLATSAGLAGATEVARLDAVGVSVLEVPAATEAALESVVLRLGGSGLVEYAEPDYRVSADLTPSDPRFEELWGLQNIGQLGGTPDADIDAPEAWDLRSESAGVAVVIDTGFDYGHEDLAANVWVNPGEIPANGLDDDGNGYVDDVHGINAITGSGDPLDDNFHGTHVSGTLGAVGDNGIGVTGVSWSTRIMACKFLDTSGSGMFSDAVECLNYVAMMKRDYGIDIRLTNNSWGGGGFSQALSDAIELTGELGILFVASAGNTGLNNDPLPRYPSSYPLPNIIAVANTDRFDRLSPTSSFGTTSVDLSAPGSSILSTLPGDAYGTLSGTSMAAPHVSGAAMLTWTQHPGFDLLDVKETLEATVDPRASLSGRVASGGRLNLFAAMTCESGDFRLTTSLQDDFEVIQSRAIVLTAKLASCARARGATVDAFFDNGDAPVELLDDGVIPDRVAGDGIHSATWLPIGLGPSTVTTEAEFDGRSFVTSVDGAVAPFSGVIDFEDIAVPPGSTRTGGDRRSSGYLFDSSTDHSHLINDLFDSHNGTTWLGPDDFQGDNRVSMSSVSGAIFSLLELDISELTGAPNGVVVRVTGNREGGDTVEQLIALDDVADGAGPLDDFQTVAFDSAWTALTSVDFDAVEGGGDRWYALDDIRVDENARPICTLARAVPDELWPPNHRLRDVVVEGVVDPEGGPIEIVVTQIGQDEPIDGRGDGHTQPDAEGLGTSVAALRSERSGSGDGRVYHVGFEASDAGGASCSGTLEVCVPHDRGQGRECVDQGALFDSITGSPLPRVIGPENGGFETGDLTGWGQVSSGSGGVVVDDGTFDPPGPGGPVAPFAGGFSAATFQASSGVHTLFQDVTLAKSLLSVTLLWADNLKNHVDLFLDPEQEWRVEVWDPDDDSVLAELFSTQPGDPPFQGWTERAGDLSPWIGQTIRIAFTHQVTIPFFNARLDEVQIVGQPPQQVTLDIAPGNGSNYVDPMGRGMVSVAILGSESFVVAAIDSATLAFGPEGAGLAVDRIIDLNGDGFPDLVSEHPIPETGIAFGDDTACVSGATIHGRVFEGCDGLRTTSAACGVGFELVLLLPGLLWLRRVGRTIGPDAGAPAARGNAPGR